MPPKNVVLNKFILFFSILPLFFSQKCFLQKSADKKCFICDFDYFNSNYLNQQTEEVECLPKISDNLQQRKILVSDSSIYKGDKYKNFLENFNEIYSDMQIALKIESFLVSQYFQINVTILVSNKISVLNESLIFFRRAQGEIQIKPLFCEDFPNYFLIDCFPFGSKVMLNIINELSVFFVAGEVSIEYIDFHIYSENDSFLIKDLGLNKCGLFILEKVVENDLIPVLKIKNCSFKINARICCFPFILILPLGGDIEIEEIILTENFSLNFIENDKNYISLENYHYSNEEIQITNKIEKISKLNIKNLNIKNLILRSETFYLFSLDLYLGNLFLQNILIFNMNFDTLGSENSISTCLFNFIDTKNIEIKNLNVSNSSYFKLLYLERSDIRLEGIFLSSNHFSDIPIFGNGDSKILIDGGIFQLNIFQEIFLEMITTEVFLKNLIIFNNLRFNLFFYQSALLFAQNKIYNNSISSDLISLIFSTCFLSDVYFSHIFQAHSIISFNSMDSFVVNNMFVSNVDIGNIFNVNTVHIFILLNSTFEKVEKVENVITYAAIIDKYILHQTIVRDSIIVKCFTVIFNYIEAFIFYSQFLNITIEEGSDEALVIWFIQGYYVLDYCKFIDLKTIEFQDNTALLSFESGLIIFNFNIMIDVGFHRLKSPSSFKFSDSKIAIYLWGCLDVIMDHNIFISETTQLFSGIIYATTGEGSFVLTNSLVISNQKNEDIYQMGMIIDSHSPIILENNYISGWRCPNYYDFMHNNGAFCFLGSSSYLKVSNSRNFLANNNTFVNCSCHAGGSIAIVNYNTVSFKNSTFFNSKSILGGDIAVFSSEIINIHSFYSDNSLSIKGSSFYFFQISNIFINNMNIMHSQNFEAVLFVIRSNIEIINANISYIKSNKGSFISVYGGQANLKNSIFQNINNSGIGGAIFINQKANLLIENVISINITAFKSGGFLHVEFGEKIEIYNLQVENLRSQQGSGILINSAIQLAIKNASFKACETLGNGIIFLKSKEESSYTSISILNCLENKAKEGSCIFFESTAQLFLSRVNIDGCINSVLYFRWPSPINISVEQIVVKNLNQASFIYSERINFLLNNTFIHDCSILDNFLYLGYSDITLIEKIVFSNNYFDSTAISAFVVKSCFFWSINAFFEMRSSAKDSDIVMIENEDSENTFIELTIFYQFDYENNKEILNFYHSDFVIKNSFFYGDRGEILFANGIFKILFESSCFENFKNTSNFGSAIFLKNDFAKLSEARFYNTSFNLNFERAVSIENINFIEIDLSQINSWRGFFGGLSLINILKIVIENSVFSNLHQDKGGAILIINSIEELIIPQYIFNNTKLQNCSAYIGGAMYFKGNFDISINKCNFSENQAIRFYNKIEEGIAGCIQAICNSLSCRFHLENNRFYMNYAAKHSPNLFANFVIQEKNNTFFQNKDGLNFSSFISTSPLSTIFLNIFSTSFIKKNYSFPNFLSGNYFTLYMNLVDFYNQTLLYDDLNVISIRSKNSNVSIQRGIGYTKAGIIIFKDILIKSPLNQNISLSFYLNAGDLFLNELNFYSRSCEIGHIIYSDFSCLKCPINYFSLEIPSNNKSSKCHACLANSFCEGGASINPNKEFWRRSNTSEMVLKCKTLGACLENSTCEQGHYGILCNDCKIGFGRFNPNDVCSKCEEYEIWAILRLVFFVIFGFFYVLLNINMTLKEKSSSIISLISKIFINHVQRISVFSDSAEFNQLSDDLAEKLKNVMDYSKYASIITEDIFSNDCFMQNFITDPEFMFYSKLIVSVCLPIILTIFYYIRVIFGKLYSKLKQKKEKTKIYNDVLYFFMISIFLFYPLLTKISLSLINCVQVDSYSDQFFIFGSINNQCFTTLHFLFIGCFTIIGIMVLGIYFPIYLSINIKKNLRSKDEKKKEVFLFFYKDYKQNFYYWESVIFIVKFFVTLFSNTNFLFSNEIIFLLQISLFFVYLFGLIGNYPFLIPQMNNLERLSIFSSIVTRLGIFCLSDTNISNFIRISIFVIIGVFNLYFFVLLIYYLIRLNQWKKLFLQTKNRFSSFAVGVIKMRSSLKSARVVHIESKNKD